MKNFKTLYFSLILSFIAFGFIGCGDLKIQKKYIFNEDMPVFNNYNDKTAWEFLQSQTTPAGTAILAANKFDYMVTLIKVAGLEEEFNKSVTNRTYLLLNNASFVGTGRINALLTGVVAGTGDLTKVDKVRAANLLKYHIIDGYVDQVKALPIYFINYEFKTLGDGDNSRITFQRNERYSLTINAAPDLPATKRPSTGVTLHNYQFKNGIAHVVSAYVGITPF